MQQEKILEKLENNLSLVKQAIGDIEDARLYADNRVVINRCDYAMDSLRKLEVELEGLIGAIDKENEDKEDDLESSL